MNNLETKQRQPNNIFDLEQQFPSKLYRNKSERSLQRNLPKSTKMPKLMTSNIGFYKENKPILKKNYSIVIKN